ncbi:MAG: glycosyltransferase family 4 protein [Gemmataceae bacterium]|nr:glycosyltransferase family 4 protein [Gemmataceae bacterium]
MIVAFCHENVDPTRGGCETYIADLAQRMLADGHEVHLLARRWNRSRLPDKIIIHPIQVKYAPRWLRPWLFGRGCLRELRQFTHDVSIGFDKTWGQDVFYPQGGVYAASQQSNLEKHALGWRRKCARGLKLFDPAVQSFRLIEQWQYRRAKVIVVNSAMTQRHVRQYLGISEHRVRVVHAAVSQNRFSLTNRNEIRQRIRTSWGVTDTTAVALFVAMNYGLKGLSPLLQALQKVPRDADWKLVVVGSPKFQRFLREAIRLGVADRVHFHGFCDDTRQVYFAADFLVHPTFYDPCSLVVLEALACGLPAITTRLNGAAELMNPPWDGLVIDHPRDSDALARAITDMLDPLRRRSAAQAAHLSSARWTFEDHYRKMMSILESLQSARQGKVESRAAC